MNIIYHFAAYSGGECILKCQGTHMYVDASGPFIIVNYRDADNEHIEITVSPNAVWTLEREQI